MDKDQWDKSNAKKLFDCISDIEKNQYPPQHHTALDSRKDITEKFIIEFGGNRVRIITYTNMMQESHSVNLDVYSSSKFSGGNIGISWGSEPQELYARRVHYSFKNKKDVVEVFDFFLWKWSEYKNE